MARMAIVVVHRHLWPTIPLFSITHIPFLLSKIIEVISALFRSSDPELESTSKQQYEILILLRVGYLGVIFVHLHPYTWKFNI